MMDQQNPQMAQIKQMINLVRSSGNPQAMLGQIAQKNPQVKQVMDYVNQNGGDAKKAFYAMAKEKGVNPNDIISMFK